MLDPKGYYATLGVDPDATSAAIHAAYRRKAKILHPDMPKTGNAGAFIRIKEAYEVLSNPLKRSEYDRSGSRTDHYGATPAPEVWQSSITPRHTEWRDMPPEIADIIHNMAAASDQAARSVAEPSFGRGPFFWGVIGAALVLLVAVGAGTYRLMTSSLVNATTITNRMSQSLPSATPTDDPGPPPQTSGTPHYVQPIAGQAKLWFFDPSQRDFRPLGELPAFTTVSLLRMVNHDRMAEIRLPDGKIAYIYPDLLVPGDATAARQASCIYNAGPPPRNAESLGVTGTGAMRAVPGVTVPARVTFTNAGNDPLVLALFGGGQRIAVFVGAHSFVTIGGLPALNWRIQYATGDLWSRPCFRFTAGMRAFELPAGPLAADYHLPASEQNDIDPDHFGH
jgi:hypothetical protein